MDLRKQLSSYIALNNYVEAIRGSQLPAGYTELEYIKSSGTQYIDIGIKGNETTKVHIKARYYTSSGAGGSGRVLGSRIAAAADAFAIGSASGTASTNSTVSFFFGNQNYLVTDKPIILDEWLDIVFDKMTHSINGVDYDNPYNDETFETPQNLKLFGFDNYGTIGVGYVDVAYCKLWDNGVLIRNLIPAKNSSGTIGMYDTISGTFFTNSGTGSFVAGPEVSTSSVVLTDAIHNGLTGLQLNGGCEQRNLPVEYTQLDYLQSDGASYLIIPYRVNNKTVFYCRYNEIQNGPQVASAVFGVTTLPDVSQANYGILRLSNGTSSFNRMGWGDSTSGSVINVNAPQNLNTWYEVLYDQNKLYQDDVLYATSATSNDTEWFAEYDLGIFARNGESVTMPAVVKISSVWAKENGKYRINLIPARRKSDSVLGMYDTVSGTFLTNAGTGTFTAGPNAVPTPDNPMDIYCNNGVLKVGPNSFNANSSNITIGYWINNNTGEIQANDSNFLINGYIPVKPNTSYVAYGRRKTNNVLSKWNRIAWYDSDKNYISTSPYTQDTIGLGTSPSNAAYARFSSNPVTNTVTQDIIDSFNWTFREGTQEYTEFIPYNNIVVEGTPETVTITGKNLYDVTKDVSGKFIGENGSIGDEPYSCYSDLIPVKEGESYTYSGICNVGSASTANNKRIHGYVNGVWNRQITVISVNKNTPFYTTFTIPAGINGIRISHWADDSNTQVEESSRPTKYEEYYQTSFAPEDLLKLGDYQDVQDVIRF